MLSASFANQSTAIAVVTTGAYYRATRTQVTSITKICLAACTLVAHAAVGTDVIVTLRAMFAASGTQIGARGTMPAINADLGATATHVTVVTKIRLAARAVVARPALHTDIIVTLGTMLVAIGTEFGTVFATSAQTNDGAVRAQQTFYAKIRLAARAVHTNTAAFTYFFVTFVAMLTALFANQSTIFAMVTRGANDRAIRTQIASITEIRFTARAIIAHTAVNAEFIVALRTMLVAFGTEFGAPFATFTAAQTDDRTIDAQTAVVAEVAFTARAIVAYSAVYAEIVVTLRTVFSALLADYGAVFTTAATHTNDDAVGTQIAVVAVTPIARAVVAHTATFTKIIVTLATMFAAALAKDGAVFAMAAFDAYYRTIRTQTACYAKTFVAARALVACSTINAKIIVTYLTVFSAIGTKIGARFASFAAPRAYDCTITAQKAVITEIAFTARAVVAYFATFTKIIITQRTMFSAIGANDVGARFASFAAPRADYRTIAAQKAVIAKTSFPACAHVAYSATFAKIIIALVTVFAAALAKDGAILASFAAA